MVLRYIYVGFYRTLILTSIKLFLFRNLFLLVLIGMQSGCNLKYLIIAKMFSCFKCFINALSYSLSLRRFIMRTRKHESYINCVVGIDQEYTIQRVSKKKSRTLRFFVDFLINSVRSFRAAILKCFCLRIYCYILKCLTAIYHYFELFRAAHNVIPSQVAYLEQLRGDFGKNQK